MFRIGLVDIDVSHPGAFAVRMAEAGLPMRYTHLVNRGFRGEDEVAGFAKTNGVTVLSSIEEMAEVTDVGFIQSCNWEKHLKAAMPYIERGKPVFLDKPLVGSVADVRRVRELSEAGAVIYGSSSARYAPELGEFLARPVEERGEVLHVFVSAGVDEFNYGIHAAEILGRLAGAPALSCRYAGRSETRDGRYAETFFATFQNGVSGTYTLCTGQWQPFEVSILTTKTSESFRIDSSRIYTALLVNLAAALEGKENELATVGEITDNVLMMLAGKVSRERGGETVRLADLPAEAAFDGDLFERGYAATAPKIYL
ncbi:MAG: Gfo/Idh/MocA family oxidoreductase [Clostridia bacterium]|nr:Gfo/Idh/MocA family oxidoreductase [Clostridia bacterium]